MGFQFSLRFSCVLQSEGFYAGRSANTVIILRIRSNPTAGGHPQTQLGTRYGWPLAHKELPHPLTGFVFNRAGCPYPYTLLTRKPGARDSLVTDNPTMKQVSTGLHGTCKQVTDLIWPDLTIISQSAFFMKLVFLHLFFSTKTLHLFSPPKALNS